MKKNFTKLVVVAFTAAVFTTPLAAQSSHIALDYDAAIPSLRIGEETADSLVVYDVLGQKEWSTTDVIGEPPTRVWAYEMADGLRVSVGVTMDYLFRVTYSFGEIISFTSKKDKFDNILPLSIVSLSDNGESWDYDYSYNEREQIIYIETREEGEIRYQWHFSYNEKGELVNYEFVSWNWHYKEDGGKFVPISGTGRQAAIDGQTWEFDSQGRKSRTHLYRNNLIYTNEPIGKRLLRYAIFHYSDGYIPTVKPENNTPIGDSNEGSFDLDINIPADSINNGSLVITLPEGFTLDEANTSLTLDFAGDFALKITKQDDNSWLLEITPKSTRSASLRADASAKTLLNVAYKVNSRTERGTYDIVVNSILFESKGGNYYPEPAITIPAEVSRWGVSNELTGASSPKTYIAGNTLYIHAAQTEQVSVYTLTGIKLYESTVSAGATTIDAAAFPQGVLIVKGADWSVKVKN